MGLAALGTPVHVRLPLPAAGAAVHWRAVVAPRVRAHAQRKRIANQAERIKTLEAGQGTLLAMVLEHMATTTSTSTTTTTVPTTTATSTTETTKTTATTTTTKTDATTPTIAIAASAAIFTTGGADVRAVTGWVQSDFAAFKGKTVNLELCYSMAQSGNGGTFTCKTATHGCHLQFRVATL